MTRADCIPVSAEAGGRDHFSCSSGAWELLLKLGNAFGWKSSGTRYVPDDPAATPEQPPPHDYQPGDQPDSKWIAAADALEWAKALSEARSSPHLTTMIGERPRAAVLRGTATTEQLRSVNAPFRITMDEFIVYAFGGEFAFFRSR